MNITFIPSCDKKGCDNPSTHVRRYVLARGLVKRVYYCDEHKRDSDETIAADLEQEQTRLDNRRKTAQRPDLGIVGSKLPMPQRWQP